MTSATAAARIDARIVPGPTRTAFALMLDVRPVERVPAAEIARDVVDAFKRERGAAPAGTKVLLVTIVGNLSATTFATEWAALHRVDPELRSCVAGMSVAEVSQAAPSGQILDRAALLVK
jgi:hypothetical protein